MDTFSVDWALLHCVAWHASSWTDCASLVWMELRVHVQWLLNDMPMMLLSYRRMERGGSSAALRVQILAHAGEELKGTSWGQEL